MNIDLTTNYLHKQLKNPLIVSACPLTGSMSSLRQLEEAGAAAVVLQSVFSEQIEHEEYEIFRLHEYASEISAESQSYFPELETYNTGPEPHLEFLEDVKRTLRIPVIASLNGTSPGKWVRFARMFELAGADALELNIYFVPTDRAMTSHDVEQRYVDIVHEVSQSIRIPVAVKIGPYFSALPAFAAKLVAAGAAGLVLFNRYLEPEIDLESLRVQPHLALSHPSELRLVLRWLGILSDQVECSLAATSGIHDADGVLKALLAGADVVLLASSLLKHGPKYLTKLLTDIEHWLAERQYASVQSLIGSVSRERGADASAFERANYMKALVSFTQKYGWS